MNIWRVTLTGVDTSTSVPEALELLEQDRRVELGILFSATRAGMENRYPEHRWIDWFTGQILARLPQARLALHICGSARRQFLAMGALPGCPELHRFARVQLNGTFAPEEERLLGEILGKSDQGPAIITQHDTNPSLANMIRSPRHQVLFDASGGRGIAREEWPAPLREKSCGYAGGLGPDSIAGEIPRIAQAASGASVWIDMESRLRDSEDRFSLPAAHAVLDSLAQRASCADG